MFWGATGGNGMILRPDWLPRMVVLMGDGTDGAVSTLFRRLGVIIQGRLSGGGTDFVIYSSGKTVSTMTTIGQVAMLSPIKTLLKRNLWRDNLHGMISSSIHLPHHSFFQFLFDERLSNTFGAGICYLVHSRGPLAGPCGAPLCHLVNSTGVNVVKRPLRSIKLPLIITIPLEFLSECERDGIGK
jgi:hypothetical protein